MLRPSVETSIILAPMEGVTDAPMRELLTSIGAFDFCVSEFLRISQSLLPDRVFLKHVPELQTGGRTASGCPVVVQLLGGDPELLAASAAQAIRLGAPGIDLNFGCPAPTVNRHDGGATLLKYPERIERIVAAVRTAVPKAQPVSAKLRLGWDDKSAIFENAHRVQSAGASWITIHARTRMQGYAPPADWEIIGEVVKRLTIPVIVNGDLWTEEDIAKARSVTGSNAFMLGRGTLADPMLSLKARGMQVSGMEWMPLLEKFKEVCERFESKPGYSLRRSKQWLRFAVNRGNFQGWDSAKQADSWKGLKDSVVLS